MRTLIVGLVVGFLSVGIVAVSANTSDAASKKGNRYYYSDSYSQRFPSATPRQRQNAWAYDHPGHYYEMDSNAFPVGSSGWWEMKRLEGSDPPR
jgi:hypothetical protein